MIDHLQKEVTGDKQLVVTKGNYNISPHHSSAVRCAHICVKCFCITVQLLDVPAAFSVFFVVSQR